MNKRIAIYPGSFDPITNGHLDIVLRGIRIFDKLIIGVAQNSRKKTMFTMEERCAMLEEVFQDQPQVEVASFEGLTVKYAKSRGAFAILRGLRAVSDFEYELQMANMNRKLSDDMDTVFMMTSEKSFFLSSASVKEVALLGGDISELVPPTVVSHIRARIQS